MNQISVCLKRIVVIIGCLFLVLIAAEPTSAPRDAASSTAKSLAVTGSPRTYRLFVPATAPTDRPMPLVLVFHGGGGDGSKVERMTGLSDLGRREGFIVAYPDGLNHQWNDGRSAESTQSHRQKVDDVGFIDALLDDLLRNHPIDRRRIYACGMSNGGIFCHYLGAKLADRLAAIAPVAGGLADPFERQFSPVNPVSVCIIQGTDDPLVPYHGGDVARNRGRIIDTDETVRRWLLRDDCTGEPARSTLPDRDASDGCRVRKSEWTSCRPGIAVVLYVIDGGGHAWPGGAQYLPQWVIGRVCRDFSATEIIWDFFRHHPRPVTNVEQPQP